MDTTQDSDITYPATIPAYQLDADGYLIGTTVADLNPMRAGDYLLPHGCVLEAPPTAAASERERYVDGAWTLEALAQPEPEAPAEPEPTPPPVLSLSEARAMKLALINASFSNAMQAISAGYPGDEISSWSKQEAEARTYNAAQDAAAKAADAAGLAAKNAESAAAAAAAAKTAVDEANMQAKTAADASLAAHQKYSDAFAAAQANPDDPAAAQSAIDAAQADQEAATAASLAAIQASAAAAAANGAASIAAEKAEAAQAAATAAQLAADTALATSTPMLGALAKRRGVPLATLVQKVILKADAFAVLSGVYIGVRQACEDQINAAQSVDEVATVMWPDQITPE
jgi:hypothetical protein